MTGRNAFYGLLLLILLAVGLWNFKNHFVKKVTPNYIFINETEDHRFDESIRMSIFAAFRRTGVQNAVLISNQDFASGTIDAFAVQLFQILQVGAGFGGRGILYVYSPAHHLLKIEVGYALEGLLPDLQVRALESAAKTFLFVDRDQDFWAELINTLNIEIFEKEHPVGGEPSVPSFDFTNFRFLSGGAGVTSASYEATRAQLAKEKKQIAPREAGAFQAQTTVDASVEVYLRSLREGLGDGPLEILSVESQIFRRMTPQTTYQLYRNWHMAVSAGVERTILSEPLAFVFFKKEQPVLPIVLKHENGLWRVQEALAWSLFQRYEDSMRVFQKFRFDDASPELELFLKAHFGNPLYPPDASVALAYLGGEAPVNEDEKALYFHFYALDEVLAALNDRAPDKFSNSELWRRIDAYLNRSHYT